MTPELLHVTYEGRQYYIPALWIAGFCQSAPVGLERSILDAVRYWHEQELLEEQFQQEELERYRQEQEQGL